MPAASRRPIIITAVTTIATGVTAIGATAIGVAGRSGHFSLGAAFFFHERFVLFISTWFSSRNTWRYLVSHSGTRLSASLRAAGLVPPWARPDGSTVFPRPGRSTTGALP